MKKGILISALLLVSNISFSQSEFYGPSISYQSQSGNMTKIGGFYLSANNDKFVYKIDATANLAYFRDKFVAIPEVGLTYYPSPDMLLMPMVEAEINPYTITPKVGFSFITFLDFSFGYGFDIKTKQDLKPIKGFTFSLGLNIPLNLY